MKTTMRVLLASLFVVGALADHHEPDCKDVPKACSDCSNWGMCYYDAVAAAGGLDAFSTANDKLKCSEMMTAERMEQHAKIESCKPFKDVKLECDDDDAMDKMPLPVANSAKVGDCDVNAASTAECDKYVMCDAAVLKKVSDEQCATMTKEGKTKCATDACKPYAKCFLKGTEMYTTNEKADDKGAEKNQCRNFMDAMWKTDECKVMKEGDASCDKDATEGDKVCDKTSTWTCKDPLKDYLENVQLSDTAHKWGECDMKKWKADGCEEAAMGMPDCVAKMFEEEPKDGDAVKSPASILSASAAIAAAFLTL